ncbi:acyltransferase family protein [Agromyces mediolanus]|uniref:acyltransferase family protein n=1 Tax=Agromyces mediolanus TaxID=41986 RepID=UPI0038380CDA
MSTSLADRRSGTMVPRGVLRSQRELRPDIQALRALAVLSVLLFHLWPNRLTGGFVGVDVFFVISGFLITLHLWRSAQRGTLSLLGFYARRVRRLAPASLLVLSASLLGVWMLVPFARWQQFGGEIVASTFLSENWYLASSAVDYLAADNPASPVQHFWTLSVEEQFYLVWPLVILLAIWMSRRRTSPAGRGPAPLVVTVLAVLAVASFTYGMWALGARPGPAYFDTFGRVWQFAAGAVIAILSTRPASRPRWTPPRTVAWLGLAVLAGTMLLLDADVVPYPGAAALLPVVGTVLVIAAPAVGPGSVGRVLSWRPVQWIGAISFGIYLWHWPLIVLLPFATGHPLTTVEKIGIAAASIVLAACSTRFVEDPIRFHRGVHGFPRRTLALALIAAIALGVSATALARQGGVEVETARNAALDRLLGGEPCVGAASLQDPVDCIPVEGTLTADAVVAAAADKSMPFLTDCIDPLGPTRGTMCESGDPDAATTVLVWGDSHAASWEPAFSVAGEAGGFHVTSAVRQGCPAGLEPPDATVGREIPTDEQQACDRRNDQVLDFALENDAVTVVVLAAYSRNYRFDDVDAVQNVADPIEQLLAAGKRVIVMRDVPMTGADAANRVNIPDCLSANLTTPDVCNNGRARAADTPDVSDSLDDRPELAAVEFLDPAERMCDESSCYAALGGIPTFADASHLAATFTRTLGPWVSEHLTADVMQSSIPAENGD